MRTWCIILVLGVATINVVVCDPALYSWFDLLSPAACCRRRLTHCCPKTNYHYKPDVHDTTTHRPARPWPLLTNEGLTEEELQEIAQERKARRERFRDRQYDRDTRRGKT